MFLGMSKMWENSVWFKKQEYWKRERKKTVCRNTVDASFYSTCAVTYLIVMETEDIDGDE